MIGILNPIYCFIIGKKQPNWHDVTHGDAVLAEWPEVVEDGLLAEYRSSACTLHDLSKVVSKVGAVLEI